MNIVKKYKMEDRMERNNGLEKHQRKSTKKRIKEGQKIVEIRNSQTWRTKVGQNMTNRDEQKTADKTEHKITNKEKVHNDGHRKCTTLLTRTSAIRAQNGEQG